MKIRTKVAAVAAPVALGAIVLGTAGQASAAVHPASLMAYHHQQKAIAVAGAEITSSGYERYAQVLALQGYGHNKGFVQYTNFNVAEPGSGVWAPVSQNDVLSFYLPGQEPTAISQHQLNAGLVFQAAGPRDLKFTGNGQQLSVNGSPVSGYTWKIAGEVRGLHVKFTITYTGNLAGYTVTAKGLIDPTNGSAKGTSAETLNGVAQSPAALDWSLPAGTFQQVDHFYAPVSSDQIQVKGQNAIVSFTIPSPAVSAGVKVTWAIHNGGTPAKDTWQESDNSATAFPETVEGGYIHMLP